MGTAKDPTSDPGIDAPPRQPCGLSILAVSLDQSFPAAAPVCFDYLTLL